ncbi:hypothetical protein [Lentzea sp. NPDC060358]|uniref:hypothetical protein n=1 Tax=Lentzea sp. NPDC060358 TaxID=3347103 RepID=UPI0036592004
MTMEQRQSRQWCESPLVIAGVSIALGLVIGVLPRAWGYHPALASALAAVLVLALAITVKYAPNRK